jgi:signal transduction histidine kinase
MRNGNIRFTVDTRGEVPVVANPGELRQVLSNLMQNAIDAVASDGKIAVRVRSGSRRPSGEKGLRIIIADNGSGIAAAHRSRIFEPFFTTKKDVGTGLGLWVSRGIIEKYNGSIAVHSCTLPGRTGTAIRIFLPFPAEQFGAPEAHAAAPGDSAFPADLRKVS